jgi:Uncharacterised nucleotidyltransferase
LRRWAAFNAVCDYLRAGLVGGAPSGTDREAAWEDLVALSSEHFVTPALAWCVRQDRSLPDDVREYLDAVLRLNSERNALLLVTLKRVAALPNAIDIEPVVLKGATELITGSYPAAGMRVIGDLDLLIPIDRVQSAAAALKKAGFAPVGPLLPPNHHHLPVLADPETAAGVELHMTVVHNRSEALTPRTWFMETTIRRCLTMRTFAYWTRPAASHTLLSTTSWITKDTRATASNCGGSSTWSSSARSRRVRSIGAFSTGAFAMRISVAFSPPF